MSEPLTGPVLLTLEEARRAAASANISRGELTDDTLVQSYIDAVVPVIEDLSRPVEQMDHSHTADGGQDAVLLPWPFMALVSVTASGVELDAESLPVSPSVGIVYRGERGVSWPVGRKNITIVATVGVTQIPGNQKLAAGMLFTHLWRARQGPHRFAANAPGDAVYSPAGFAVPKAVAELLVATPRLPGFA